VPTAVVAFSGGLDSATLAYALAADDWSLITLSVDYGQRHRRELNAAAKLSAFVGATHRTVRLEGLELPGSSLTDDSVGVPDGHYTDESMKATVVPNRNAVLLDLCVAIAVAEHADAVACAVHAGDHAIYPDCRPEFIAAFQHQARLANEGFIADDFEVLTPFLHRTKAEIVRLGGQLVVPFADTWSCYRGGDRHCGRCGTCVERREAFAAAAVDDPTSYEPD
jgi:7-cyano-7-deazaguanine synthase